MQGSRYCILLLLLFLLLLLLLYPSLSYEVFKILKVLLWTLRSLLPQLQI
jgi:hypothetical protein